MANRIPQGIQLRRIKAFLLKRLKKREASEPRKEMLNNIVALRYDRIGDMIVSLPLFKSLHKGLINPTITVVASEVNACIARQCEYVDSTIIKPRSIFLWLLCLLRLRATKPDLVIDLNHAVTPHTIFATLIINPKHVATPFKTGRWGVKGSEIPLFDIMPPQHKLGYARPIAETYLDIARHLECETRTCLPYPLKNYTMPNLPSEKIVVLNTDGSRRSMKLRITDVMDITSLAQKVDSDIKILIPATLRNYESLVGHGLNNLGNVKVLTPTDTILPLLRIIQFAKLVITPDTSLVHIACAYSVPLVAVYTADQELFHQWQPLANSSVSVIRSTECKSLKGYSSASLLDAVSRQLNSLSRTNRQ